MFGDTYLTVPVPSVLEEYDYIVVGGGTAGCVIANRLSAAPNTSVLVVERGGVKAGWVSRVPLLSTHAASDGSRSCVFRSTPQEHLGGRCIDLVTGSSLGGASKINSMIYNRGVPAEYNAWRDAGRVGWGYEDIKPFFTRSESDLDHDLPNVKSFHGASGEWPHRSNMASAWSHTSLIKRVTSAFGIPYLEDMNDPSQPPHGCAKIHFNITGRGQRSSTLSAFLPAHLVRSRKNLHICTPAIVQRIHVSSDKTAEGVWIQGRPGSSARFVRARREVILSAGPLASPKILMLSGIGPAEHLAEHQVTVHKDLPGVGSHLQDHAILPLQFTAAPDDSLIKLQSRPWLLIAALFKYLLFGTGLFLAPVLELSIFIQSRLLDDKYRLVAQTEKDIDAALPQNLPDIEIMPIATGDGKRVKDGGFAIFPVLLRPTSKGTVRLASADPLADPLVDPNYLATENDRRIMRSAVRFSLQLTKDLTSHGYPVKDAVVPGPTDEDIDEFVRVECMSSSHYSSACRMAPESEGGVVDDQLRVHGVRKLRVADSSVFPTILGAHLAAATVVVAEKCAEMVGDYKSSVSG